MSALFRSIIESVRADLKTIRDHFNPSESLRPTYYTQHPSKWGGAPYYRVADPQPVRPVQDWSMSRPDHISSDTAVKVLAFLLEQAPMLDAPQTLERAAHAVAKFAYIHPKTFAKFAGNSSCFHIPPSPTNWIRTKLMPEGRVIFTPNALPGIEKILAG